MAGALEHPERAALSAGTNALEGGAGGNEALGHIQAVEKAENTEGLFIYNLGTGKGYSVLDVVKAFEKASGVNIPYKIGPRRDGDIATCYSDPSKAEKELGWKAQRDIEEMCEDSWRWQKQNPNGYPD